MLSINNTISGQGVRSRRGDEVSMATTDPLHYGERTGRESESDDVSSSFADVLTRAINRVNDLEVDSQNINQQMITEPDSVDIHTVMISAQKAEVALSLTRAVRDEAVRAFRELMNLR